MGRWWLTAAVLAGCRREADPCAIEARVESVDAAIATLDELPQPVTLACFLVSLERPLGVVLTSDVFNTQPAQGVTSPRILIRNDDLALTVVPVGEARDLLEFGERHPSGFTVKAEIAFPVDGPLEPDAPYLRTLASPGAAETGCHTCHAREVDLGDGRFANNVLRPPDDQVVPLEVLVDENTACDWAADPYRCELISALLDHGEVYERPFPEDVATQFLR